MRVTIPHICGKIALRLSTPNFAHLRNGERARGFDPKPPGAGDRFRGMRIRAGGNVKPRMLRTLTGRSHPDYPPPGAERPHLAYSNAD